jgi:hypothetical protein
LTVGLCEFQFPATFPAATTPGNLVDFKLCSRQRSAFRAGAKTELNRIGHDRAELADLNRDSGHTMALGSFAYQGNDVLGNT